MSPTSLPVLHDASSRQEPDDTDDFLCARCSRRQKTCCQFTDIVLTDGDVQRVSEYAGRSDFIEYRPAGGPEYLDQDDDPTWRDATFRPDGTRRVVKWKPDGDCTFLGPAGCVLPYETRPLICRLYPFEYDEQGVFDEPATSCPTHLLPEGTDLFDALGMRRTDAERWHDMLYTELRADLANRRTVAATEGAARTASPL
jgi:Fe-S-cluster containining protein